MEVKTSSCNLEKKPTNIHPVTKTQIKRFHQQEILESCFSTEGAPNAQIHWVFISGKTPNKNVQCHPI